MKYIMFWEYKRKDEAELIERFKQRPETEIKRLFPPYALGGQTKGFSLVEADARAQVLLQFFMRLHRDICWINMTPLTAETSSPMQESEAVNSLLILYTYHHKNTEKIAKVFAKVLDAQIKTPQQINPEELQDYNLVGFGSGIYGDKHHKLLLDLADELPQVIDCKAFIFSTAALTGEKKLTKDHSALREKLQSKGYVIVDEFQCKGFNTNSFMKYLGGMNKDRPNAQDLKNAQEFAQNLEKYINVL